MTIIHIVSCEISFVSSRLHTYWHEFMQRLEGLCSKKRVSESDESHDQGKLFLEQVIRTLWYIYHGNVFFFGRKKTFAMCSFSRLNYLDTKLPSTKHIMIHSPKVLYESIQFQICIQLMPKISCWRVSFSFSLSFAIQFLSFLRIQRNIRKL